MKKPILYMLTAATGLSLLHTPLQAQAAPCRPRISVIRICPGSVTPCDVGSLDVNSLLKQLGITGCNPWTLQPAPEQPAEAEPSPAQPAEEALAPAQPAEEEPAPEQLAEAEPAPEQLAEAEPTPEQLAEAEPAPEQPAEESYHEYVLRIVSLVNAERAKAGLQPVTLIRSVTDVAQLRAKETVTLFSHTRPNGTSCFTALAEAGISYRGAGENIAYGQRSPEEVMDGWMNSSGHRANILNTNFTTIGVGYYQAANGVKYWSQMFTY